MTEVKFIDSTISPQLKGYIDLVEDTRKKMYDNIGIPQNRMAIGYDPCSSVSASVLTAYNTVLDKFKKDSLTYMRYIGELGAWLYSSKKPLFRLPRKKKKLIKNRFKLNKVSGANLSFNYEVYKMSKYYSCAVKKERP